METADRPTISILMAVYEPRLDWLEEQLQSLNAQDYPNIKLWIRDDASKAVSLETIRSLAEKFITHFPFVLAQNEKNLGSNGTFEVLTREADGIYFAYCDQDDVWLPNKLSILQETLETSRAKLVCSDMYVIDENGTQVADSIQKVRHTVRLQSGNDLAQGLLFHNFVTGCTMLLRAEDAKAAIPFCPHYVHDQYLAIWCADKGRVESVRQPLIRYRIHSSNQTAQMTGVYDKKSYEEMRIRLPLQRLEWLQAHVQMTPQLQEAVESGLVWIRARLQNWNHKGCRSTVWKYRAFGPVPALFELICNWMPERIFKKLITLAKKI